MRAAPEANEHVDEEREPADEHHQHQPVHDDDDLVDARRVRGGFDGQSEPVEHQAIRSSTERDRRTMEMMNRRNPASTHVVTPIKTKIPRLRLARTVSSDAAALKQTGQLITDTRLQTSESR